MAGILFLSLANRITEGWKQNVQEVIPCSIIYLKNVL